MGITSRRKLNHPALGSAGGTALYAAVENLYTVLGNDDPARYYTFTSLPTNNSVVYDHNFGVSLGEYRVLLYSGTFPDFTPIESPSDAGWNIIATKTTLEVVTPLSGGPFTGMLFLIHDRAGSGSGGLTPEVMTTNTVAQPNKMYLVDTSAGPLTLTFPSGTGAASVGYIDAGETFHINKLTLIPASGQRFFNYSADDQVDVTQKLSTAVGYRANGTSVWKYAVQGVSNIASGAGEKNYFATGSNDASGWVSSDPTKMTVTTDSTATNFPANATQKTAIKFLATAAGVYAYKRFPLDTVDLGRKLKVAMDQAYAGAQGNYSIAIYSNTAAGYAGTSTLLSLSPDGVLPSGTGPIKTKTFDTPTTTQAAPYLELRVISNVASPGALYVNNFIVGPGTVGFTVPLGRYPWTPTIVGFTGITTNTLKARRVDDCLHLSGTIFANTPDGNAASYSLPPGLTAGVTYLQQVGRWNSNNSPATSPKAGTIFVDSGSSVIMFGRDEYALNINAFANNAGNIILPNGAGILTIVGEVIVPIAQWAGQNSIGVGPGNDVEYAYNTNVSATASDTTSFANGPGGVAFNSSWVVGTAYTRRVRFSSPVQSSDLLILEILSAGTWVPMDSRLPASLILGSNAYGPLIAPSNVATDVDVIFQQGGYAANSATYAANGAPWGSLGSFSWRLRRANATAPSGQYQATADTTGFVSGNGGYPGSQVSTAVAPGNLGQIIPFNTTVISPTAAGSWFVNTTPMATLPIGKWAIHTWICSGSNTGLTGTQFQLSTSTTGGAGGIYPYNVSVGQVSATIVTTVGSIPVNVNLSAPQAYYAQAYANGASAPGAAMGGYAQRIG